MVKTCPTIVGTSATFFPSALHAREKARMAFLSVMICNSTIFDSN